MRNALEELEEALADEIRLESELLAVGTRKRDALVSLDMKGVEQATSREQNILLALGSAAETRLRRTAEAARHVGLQESEMSVTRIAQRSGEPHATRLVSQAGELRKLLKDVGRINGSNKALTEQSLDHVKHFFRVLGGGQEEVTYTRRGLESRPETPKVMIDEVA